MVNITVSAAGEPPVDNRWQAAEWLLARHPGLARLVDRVPGAVDGDGDLDLDGLGEIVRGLDTRRRAWSEYKSRTYEPLDEDRWQQWHDAGPRPDDHGPVAGVQALGVMSRTEVARLRLLATLGDERVEFLVGDLDGWDADGLRLIRDWCAILTAGSTHEDLDALEARLEARTANASPGPDVAAAKGASS